MKAPQIVFAEYLADQNLKMTPQRRIILDTLLRQNEHLSSEELYARVKKRTRPSARQRSTGPLNCSTIPD